MAKNIIGKITVSDIFNDRGTLLIPISTIITLEHIEVLEKHHITLKEHEVAAIGPYSNIHSFQHEKIVEEMVEEVQSLFENIRKTREIPIAHFRHEIVPLIDEAADTSQLLGLFASLQAKDDYTYRHNIGVGAISNLIGKWLGFKQQELLQLTTAALLHDIGKMLVPIEILNKPSKLTDEEFELMKQHTLFGYDIIKETIGTSHRQALVALQHHERMDGSGYPFGIKGEQIDLFSRIVSIADIFHAMTSKRVYRDPAPFYEVLSEMDKGTYGELDPKITKLFIEKIMTSLIGSTVLLSDEREATIIFIHPNDPTRPLVKTEDEFADLSKSLFLQIKQIL